MNMWTRAVAFALLLASAPAGASVTPAAQDAADVLFFSDALGINSDGTIASAGCTTGCRSIRPFASSTAHWNSRNARWLCRSAFDLNNDGVIVGQADTAAVDAGGVTISLAFVAAAGDTAVRSLGSLPGYAHSQAFAVNDRGEIVGWAYNTDLTQPGGLAPTSRPFISRLTGSARHRIVWGPDGCARYQQPRRHRRLFAHANGITHAFVLERGEMAALPGLGGRMTEALGINDRGQIVGAADSVRNHRRPRSRYCCYPSFEPLLNEALRHVEHAFAYSYPRDLWYVHSAIGVENAVRRLKGNPFRAFVHPVDRMTQTIERVGFHLAGRRQTWNGPPTFGCDERA